MMEMLSDLMTPDYFVALAIVAVAGLMRGFAGFGSGMLMAPIFAILFGPVETVAIIILMESVVTVQLIPHVFREIEWRFILPMGGVAALFMPLGLWFLVTTDPEIMGRAMAAAVLISVLILATGWRYHGEKRLPITMGVGALSGAMWAATSLGNPPVILYMLSGRDSAAVNRANITGYFALGLTMMVMLMTFRGLISVPSFGRTAGLLPLFMACAWVGSRLFRKANEVLYRWVSLILLFLVGAYGLLR